MTSADTIIFNARVLTMNPARPRAEALAISGNRILRAGSPRPKFPASSRTSPSATGG